MSDLNGKEAFTYLNIISYGAITAFAGYVLSVPAAFIFMRVVSPQPDGISPVVFSKNYHTVQHLHPTISVSY